jgi:cytochrome c2
MRYYMLWLSLGTACWLAAAVSAHASDVEAGKLLYQDNCSICHGIMESDARHHMPGQFPWQRVQVHLLLPGAPRLALASTYSADASVRLARDRAVAATPTTDEARVAVAPPYGPSLRGVYGRQAGTVPGFAYSRAFKQILQGVVWDRSTLDRWIADSQAWVPGSLMFYKQPDPDIRRKIITYLEANH